MDPATPTPPVPPPSPTLIERPHFNVWLLSPWLIVILLIAAFTTSFYFSYQQNALLQQQYAKVQEDNVTLQQQVTQLTQQNTELQQSTQTNCDGTLVGNVCLPKANTSPTTKPTQVPTTVSSKPVQATPAVTISADPSSGFSPLDVRLIVRAPSVNYSIDFGDGSAGWLSGGPNAQSSGDCEPDSSGLCSFVISHTYIPSTVSANTNFTTKIKQGTATVASTIINVSNN